MKNLLSYLSALMLAFCAHFSQVKAADAVTLHGEGVCAKCALGQTDSCQNAIKLSVEGKEVIYLLTPNDASKAFHKNVCSGSANISVVGKFIETGGKKFFTATKLSLRKDDLVKGEGLCLKCALGLTPSCQNAIRVNEDGKQVLYIIEHNDVSKAFHKNVCQATAAVTAEGKVSQVEGLLGVKKLTATKIDVVKTAAKKATPKKKPAIATASAEQASVTIKGLGLCAKCELGQTAECQNAIKLSKDGKDLIYLFAANDISKAFHKNVCTGTANIIATGSLGSQGDKPLFTATSLKLQEVKKLEGTGLCLKCELGLSRTCQNAIRVSADGKETIYRLDQNGVSKKFHKHVCQDSVALVAEGTVAKIGDHLEFTASRIDLK